MIKVIFITDSDGKEFIVNCPSGKTLMEVAYKNNIPGIIAECGGACACATCHVIIDDDWIEHVELPNSMEDDMLDFAYDRQENSRLSCQIKLDERLNGLIVHIPPKQN
ncbi:2Fe-2S iron-sulfur cluster-binding protein [Bartonella tamiae]|uniref:2Fe-2S iron-sulfur cluster-binding protein n=1 Tax=Bartonella tamiae TaxID=373638 RepID=UPI00054EAA07